MGKRAYSWQYSTDTEQRMKAVYESLSEKDRRIYGAIEAQKLPRGGITYIARVLGCARQTIRQGIKELNDPRTLPPDRIRRRGGGAKPKLQTIEGIDAGFLEIVRDYTAGDPMKEQVLWTDLGDLRVLGQLRDLFLQLLDLLDQLQDPPPIGKDHRTDPLQRWSKVGLALPLLDHLGIVLTDPWDL